VTRREPPLDEKVALIGGSLSRRGVPHAFGGALALAYYAEPRSTIDIDLNVFVAPSSAALALDALREAGAGGERRAAERAVRAHGQARIRWGSTPVDLFFSTDPFHDACAAGARQVPFGPDRIAILAPEHLIVCKAAFDRRKDWIDIEQMLFLMAVEIDLGEIRTWLHAMLGLRDRRTRRFERAVRTVLDPEESGRYPKRPVM